MFNLYSQSDSSDEPNIWQDITFTCQIMLNLVEYINELWTTSWKKYVPGWMGGLGGLMDGCKSRFWDCLHQSKNFSIKYKLV